MKIAHVADFYLPRLGGIEVHVHDLAERQRRAGHEVDVITSSPPPADGPDEQHVFRIGDGLRWQHPLNPAAAARVHAHLRHRDYDVVHAHAGVWSSLAFAGALSATVHHIPAVVTWHSLLSWAHPLYRVVDWSVDYTHRPVLWTAVSRGAAEPLCSLLPDGTNVGVLPNAVDLADWTVEPAGRDPRDVHLVAVMRLAPRKRPRALLKTLAAVCADLPAGVRVQVSIVGEGPERASMERFIRRHGLADVVSLPGRLTRAEIRDLYRRADIFLAPAKLESFGIAALEARCAGLPVVAMRQTGIADFVVDGQHGVLVDSDRAMAEAVSRLVADPAARTAMAQRSRRQPPPFGWDDALSGLDAAYGQAAALIGRTLPPPRLLQPAAPTPVG